MIQKLTVTKAVVSDKKADGTPYISKHGPYVRVAIQTKEYGNQVWLSGFAKSANEGIGQIKDGDDVTAEVEKKEQDGKTYYNFRLPKPEDKMMAMIRELDSRLRIVEDNQRKQFNAGANIYPPRSPDVEELPLGVPEEHIDPDDIPF